MLKYSIVPTYHKKRINYNKRKFTPNIRPNLLNGYFNPSQPNQVWVTDICHIQFGKEERYLSVILDLYDRKVVACKIHKFNNLALVLETLLTARLYRYDAKNVIIHSDQGVQYTSPRYHKVCRDYGFIISMSRPATPTDNAVIESFFSRLRAETEESQNINSIEEKEKSIFDWIDFHDTDRISLPRKPRKKEYFNYNKAIEKAKEFENLKLKKIKLWYRYCNVLLNMLY